MSLIKKLIAVIFVTVFLMGCQEQQLTYSYLMQHPDIVKEKVEQCESQSFAEKSQEQIAQCKIVMNAATNLMSIMSTQQQDPEQFGQKILDAEMASAKAKQELIDAQKKLDAFKGKEAPSAELKAANEKLQQAHKNFQEKHDEVSVLLAVIGMSSPE